MKFINEVYIDAPLPKVIELFDNPANMDYWQPGFISFEPVAGKPGEPGSKARLRYKAGSRSIVLLETIRVRNLPGEFIATYETKGMFNVVRNSFFSLPDNKTRWETENEYSFSGMMKLFAWLRPGTFKKQTQQFLEQFKHFAEKKARSSR